MFCIHSGCSLCARYKRFIDLRTVWLGAAVEYLSCFDVVSVPIYAPGETFTLGLRGDDFEACRPTEEACPNPLSSTAVF